MRGLMQAATMGAVLILLAACGSDQPTETETAVPLKREGTITVAAVPRAVAPSGYWNLAERGARCAAKRSPGVELRWEGVPDQADAAGQKAVLERELARKPDAVAYAPTDQESSAAFTKQTLRDGIAVSNFDTGSEPQPQNVPLFSTDDFTAARDAARYLTTPPLGSPSGGKLGVLEFQPGGTTNDQRVAGFLAELDTRGGWEVSARESSNNDAAAAARSTENILRAHPDVTALFAANESATVGAADALRRAGKAGQIALIGWDAGEPALAALRDGTVRALIAQNPFRMAYDAVRAVIARLRDGKSLSSVNTGTLLVTRDNLDAPETAALLNPTCENPPPGVPKG